MLPPLELLILVKDVGSRDWARLLFVTETSWVHREVIVIIHLVGISVYQSRLTNIVHDEGTVVLDRRVLGACLPIPRAHHNDNDTFDFPSA